MKTKTCIIAMLLASGLINSHAQDTWTRKADFGGTATYGTVGFSIGGKGYVGTGHDLIPVIQLISGNMTLLPMLGHRKRTSEEQPEIVQWAFPSAVKAISVPAPMVTSLKDFWEYDPATNIWTQKADFGGTARY